MKILFLCLEKPDSFPYCPALEVLEPTLKHGEFSAAVEVLENRIDTAIEAAKKSVEKEQPDFVIVLSNAVNNMEFVLYRYAHNQWTPGLEDNHGRQTPAGEIVTDSPGALIGSANLMRLLGVWQSAQSGQFSHVTMGLGSDGSLENAIYYSLLLEGKDKNGAVIGHIGVPPFAEEHDILKPETLQHTFTFLVTELIKLSG